MRLTIKIDDSQLRKLSRNLPKRMDAGVFAVASACRDAVVKHAPKDTGELKGSIRVTKKGSSKLYGSRYLVHSVARSSKKSRRAYAGFQEFGTGLRKETWEGFPTGFMPIVPKKKKVLRFEWKGQTMYRHSVAGAPSRHYFKQALDEIEPRIPSLFAMGFNAPVSAIGKLWARGFSTGL